MRFHDAFISFGLLLLLFSATSAQDAIQVVSHDSVSNPRQPQVAINANGEIFVAFGSGNSVYCCRSIDLGTSFERPIKVGDVPQLALGKRRGPRIVANHELVVVTAAGHQSGNLLAWQSRDNGATWTGPTQVNDAPNAAREGLHAMAMSSDGSVFCTWLDLRNGKTQLFGATSTDGGMTWNTNREIYRSPDGSICECCHPSATFDSAGELYVMWRNSLQGNRDLYLSTSRDDGATFDKATQLGTGNWKLDACPMDGGCVAVAAPGNVTTVWRRDNQVFCTEKDSSLERLLGTGEQPWAAATVDGSYVVWLSQRGGDLWLLNPDGRSRKIAKKASDPVIAAATGGAGPVVAVWESTENQTPAILAAVIH